MLSEGNKSRNECQRFNLHSSICTFFYINHIAYKVKVALEFG